VTTVCTSCLIHLPVPSPVLSSKCPAAVEYDARLHVDTHTASLDGHSDNTLSISARFAATSNWVLLELAGNEHMLLYKSVADAWPEMRNARRRQDLFQFPPESVAHMAHVFSQLQCVSRRWASDLAAARAAKPAQPAAPPAQDAAAHDRADPGCFQRYHNDLIPAMLLFGASAGPEQVAHEQYALTLSSVQDGRELPCMSWEHGLLFTAQIQQRRVILRPTEPTHRWPDVETMANGAVQPFAELPLPEGSSVCVSEFYELLKHGIVMLDDGISVDLNPKKKPGARSLSCTLCPVVHWPVLLLLVQSGWTVSGRSLLTLRESAHVFREHTTRHSSLLVTADVLPRVRPQLSAFAAAEGIEAELLVRTVEQCLALEQVSALVLVETEALGIWRQHVDGSLVFFASAAELCFSALDPRTNFVQFIASHPEHGLCNVEVLENGRHAARHWRFWQRSVLQEFRDDAERLLAEHAALAHTGDMDACARELFDSARESLSENRLQAEKNLAEASVAGRRTYRQQTIFDLSSRTPK